MKKILLVSPEKCTSCRTCELACSYQHDQEFNPARSRITVLSWEKTGISIPVICLQCDDAACVKVCKMGAIIRNEETGALVIDQTKCNKCRQCVKACPFDRAVYDSNSRSVIKCDLCNGNPECVRNCAAGAITFVEGDTENLAKKEIIESKFKEIYEGVK